MKWSNLITPSLYPDCVSSPQDAEAQGQIICLMLQQYLGPRCPISLPKLFLFRLCDQFQYFPPPIKSWINLRSRGRQVITTTCSRQGGPSQPANPRVWRWDGGGTLFLLSNFNFNLFVPRQMRNIAQSGLCPQPTSLPPPSPARTARTARSSLRRRRTRISTRRTPLWSSKRRLDLRLELSSPCQSRHSPLPVS